MVVIRNTEKYELNEGSGMARGLYNISNAKGDMVSNWFDVNVKDELLELTDVEFDNQCKVIIK